MKVVRRIEKKRIIGAIPGKSQHSSACQGWQCHQNCRKSNPASRGTCRRLASAVSWFYPQIAHALTEEISARSEVKWAKIGRDEAPDEIAGKLKALRNRAKGGLGKWISSLAYLGGFRHV
ncbi:MAG: hypothetical protein A4E57_04433 [Syntrophorhabdaceae bacterium PtaU1.Bin034]|nr:MAG: hypothetical protein A4E57_04433 [Syntrophorhabdaceae bacterium PtaU1.Bin034]